ncbi:MAG: hypothetical protein ABIS50_04360 [Luteolibacter sp.]|uniref:ABC transporter permease n=1 Tax=Luteolibacter sp. TaxID=1962973 RepID=UPI0032667848
MSLVHLTDFSDKLSPMLVKELRQGMRARSFTMLFLIFQGLLALILLTAGASVDSNGAGTAASGIIFTMFSIAVLFIQPMRGVNALSTEITGNTIEMMVLTRLSAWRIVFGKWIAIVSQSALILTTIIPYLILRYFFGGMILLGELVFLTLIFLTSMALTAVMVGFSATSTKLVRVLPIVGIIILANVVPGFLFRGSFGSGMSFFTLSDWPSRMVVFCYVAFITYFGWCALSNGTSAIAPVAENHSTIRRLIALGLACITAFAGLHPDFAPEAVAAFLAIILAPAVITALTEPAIVLPPVCKPFLKRGLPGRVAAAFLLPGWPTGVFYTSLMAGVGIAGIAVATVSKPHLTFDSEFAIVCLACFGAILLPALLAAAFSKQETKRFTNFMAFLVVSIALTVGVVTLAGVNNHQDLLWFFIWNPPVFVAMLAGSHFDHDTLLMAATVVDFLILALLIVTAMMGYRDYDRIFVETEEGLARDAKPAEPSISGI